MILGGLLAIATVVGFVMSKEGQKLTEELQKHLKTLAKQVKKNLSKLEDVTKEHFDELVTTIVDEYDRNKQLGEEAKKTLTKALQQTWHEMEKEYLNEKNEEETA